MADGSTNNLPPASPGGNAPATERRVSLVLAGLLAVMGARRLSLSSVLLLAASGAMAYRGTTGYCPLYDALDVNTDNAA